MSVEITVQLKGLVASLTHGPSKSPLRAVPPLDNGGDGSSFSPTDLLAASFASCAVMTTALVSAQEGLSFGDASAKVVKVMSPPPRRVESLELVITMPAGTKPEQRARLEEIARGCPVARSLHPDVKALIRFEYPEDTGSK